MTTQTIVETPTIRPIIKTKIETYIIKETLKLVNDNRKETANILGMSERSLYRKIDAMKAEESGESTDTQPEE